MEEKIDCTGILHCHSTYSYDGKMSLQELKALFQKSGIQFVCMTEHVDEMTDERAEAFVRECVTLSDDTFLFIPGFEVSYKKAHVLTIGARQFFGNYAPTIEVLRRWAGQASFVVLAHPVRNHFAVDDGLLETIGALEVWNQQYDGKRVPRTRSLTLLSELRARKQGLLAIGGVDFHRKEHLGAPLLKLTVDTLTEHDVIEQLKKGTYTIVSAQATFSGTLPHIGELRAKHRLESIVSVVIITIGKLINRVLASVGISLPKSLKQLIRKKL